MATSIFGCATSSGNDAEFRAAGSAISAALSGMLTRVTTSSDINWATVARPTTDNTFEATFDVFRFNDAAQATHPLFLKFEYGRYTSTSPIHIRLTIGKTCSGAGVLGGIVFPATVITSYSAGASSTIYSSYISNGDGHCLCLAITPANNAILLMIERAIDSNGAVLGNGLWVAFKSEGTMTNYFCAYDSGANTNYTGGIFPSLSPLSSGQSFANGSITPYFPAACFAPNGLYWIPRAALGGALADCSLGTTRSALLDGNTYLGVGNAGRFSDQRGQSYSGLLMRWS
ncbi:hypothetical protein FK216_12030 [Moraxellaceae bacterium AER2_44_116]|nr:hypothetical protein FK216_12030 [Moraxellaceae bacterium AER2_44_116]